MGAAARHCQPGGESIVARTSLGIHGALRLRDAGQRTAVLNAAKVMLDKGTGTDLVWREDIFWSDVQAAEGGAYDWTIPDQVVKAAADAGFRVWVVLSHPPAWATAVGGTTQQAWPCPPYAHKVTAGGNSALDAYAAFCAAAAARYARSGVFWDTYIGTPRAVTHFEVWNEEYTELGSQQWNGIGYDAPHYSRPDQYAEIFNVASAAITAAALFAMPVASLCDRTWNSFPVGGAYLATFLEHLTVQLPAVSLHPYVENYYPASYIPPSTSDRGKFFSQVTEVRTKLNGAGRGSSQIWLTEVGWPSRPGYVTEAQQADRFTDLWTVVQNLGYVRGLFIYTTTNPDAPDNPALPGYHVDHPENYLALWHTGAGIYDLGLAKPAVATVAGLPSLVIGPGGGTTPSPQPTDACVHPDHFENLDGTIAPQPWMQWRPVKTIAAEGKSGSYGVAGGGNKNDLLHTLQVTWQNNTPLPQLVYGLVTRGGVRVALQARSRAYIREMHGLALGTAAPPVVEASRCGTGLDAGAGGVLTIQTDFGVVTYHQHSHTNWLMPAVTGWREVLPGQSITARVDVRFTSENWEGWLPESGADGSESSYISGDTRLDLYAVPKLT